MKKILLGDLLVVAVLATAGFAAMQVGTTEASAKANATQADISAGSGGIDNQQDKESSRPYIGISIRRAPEDGDIDGALVVSVVEGSPADGNLQGGRPHHRNRRRSRLRSARCGQRCPEARARR